MRVSQNFFRLIKVLEIIVVLCVAGIYVAAYMFNKQQRIERGELIEDSVVSTPRAKLGGVSNGLFGLSYYVALLLCVPWLHDRWVYTAALIAAALAAAYSLYLAYSLLFVTKRPCVYCWAGHSINWLLFLILLFERRLLVTGG